MINFRLESHKLCSAHIEIQANRGKAWMWHYQFSNYQSNR